MNRRSLGLVALAAMSFTLGAPLAASASPDKPVIALSNSYYGNTYRRQMVASVDKSNLAEMAKDLKPGLLISPSFSQEWVQQNLIKK